MPLEHRRIVRADRRETLIALDEAAEMWNAAWKAEAEGGLLHLPLLAGVRRGRLRARVEVRSVPNGSEVRMVIDTAEYEVNRPALVFLILGALGGLVTILWPIYPERLLRLVPLGVVLMIGAWLVVASRLRSAGPQEFLEDVAELAEGGFDDSGADRASESAPPPVEPGV